MESQKQITILIFALSLVLITCMSVQAGGLQLIKSGVYAGESYDFVTKDGIVYFVGPTDYTSNNYFLWRTDGTETGTYVVNDSIRMSSGQENSLFNLNGTLLFKGVESSSNWELFKSDGTAAGTVMVKEINPDTAAASPSNLYAHNGKLYFTADNGSTGRELWKSDGTAAGTTLLKDIYPDSRGSRISLPSSTSNKLIFIANSQLPTYGTSSTPYYANALWKSDGTTMGTVLLKDFNPDSLVEHGSDHIKAITKVGDSAYIYRQNGFTPELWVTDGSLAGTTLLTSFDTFGNIGGPLGINGTTYFTYKNELWKTDGTPDGTSHIQTLISEPSNLSEFNGYIFFQVSNPQQLWKTDGAPNGAELVYEFDSLTGPVNTATIRMVTAEGKLFIRILDSTNKGATLWESDGTTEGTTQLRYSETTRSVTIKSVDNKLFVSDSDGLWQYDPTFERILAPVVFADNPQYSDSITWAWGSVGGGGEGVYRLKVNDPNLDSGAITTTNTAYTTDFTLTPGNEYTLYIQEQYSAGVWSPTASYKVLKSADLDTRFKVSKISDSIASGIVVSLGNKIYFTSRNPSTYYWELYQHDVQSGNISLVKTFSYGISSIIEHNGSLIMSANDGTTGYELWKSDGTPEGTTLVKDIYPGTTGSSPSDFIELNGQIIFTANDSNYYRGLWKTDGTASGTQLIKNFYIYNYDAPYNLTKINGKIYFGAEDRFGEELWKTDGTTVGTILLKNIYPEDIHYMEDGTPVLGQAQDSGPYGFTNVNGAIFFAATDGLYGRELWKTDGTTSGTVFFKDIYPGTRTITVPIYPYPGSPTITKTVNNSSSPNHFTNINGILFFEAFTEAEGLELWKSDGTSGGTVLVKDIDPGTHFSSPSNLYHINGVSLFSADSGYDNNGRELWVTDGSAANTSMLFDINPGGSNSNPTEFLKHGDTLFFVANDGGVWGNELWRSDGTFEGTKLVKDLVPGPNSSNPSSLASINDKLYFYADKGLWVAERVASPPLIAGETPVRNRRPTWTWTSSGGGNGTYRYKLDDSDLSVGATTTAATSYTAGSLLALGEHTLYVEEQNDLGSWSHTSAFTVLLNNDYPVAQDTSGLNTSDLALDISLLSTDPDNDSLTFYIYKGPRYGRVIINGSKATYIPDIGYSGTDSFSYFSNDDTLNSNIAFVSVNVTPTEPLQEALVLDADKHTFFFSRRIEPDDFLLYGDVNTKIDPEFSKGEGLELPTGVQISLDGSMSYESPFNLAPYYFRIRYKTTPDTCGSNLVIYVNNLEQDRINLAGDTINTLYVKRSSPILLSQGDAVHLELDGTPCTGALNSVIIDYIEFFPAEVSVPTLTITQENGLAVGANDQIGVLIPAGIFSEWYSDVSTVSLSGNAAAKVDPNVSYDLGNKALILNVTADLVPGDSVEVSGLKFIAEDIASDLGQLKLTVNSNWQQSSPGKKLLISSIATVEFDETLLQTGQVKEIGPVNVVDMVPPQIQENLDLRLVIPASVPVTWDSSITGITLSGTAQNRVNPQVSYSADKKTMTLDVTENFYFGDHLKISGAKVVSSQDYLFKEIKLQDKTGFVIADQK